MNTHTIINGNSLEEVKKLSSIHLVISSPPYFNAKKYKEEALNVGNNANYDDYLYKIECLIEDMYKALVPGGYVCWNTSPVLDNGKRLGIPFDTHSLFVSNGFEFQDDIIWKKPDGAAGLRCGGWVRNEHRPTTWHAKLVAEYIMIYKKPGKRVYGEYTHKMFEGYDKDILTNVWFMKPETNKHWHDAPYPEELVKRLLLLYSFEGDVVLDPFGGTLTTSKVASKHKRSSVSIELSKEYMDKALETFVADPSYELKVQSASTTGQISTETTQGSTIS